MLCSTDTRVEATDLTGRNCGRLSETLAYWAQPESRSAIKRAEKNRWNRMFMVVIFASA
jgi:hypothetical protein